MKSSVRELAKALYISDTAVDIYELHARFILGPAEILRSIEVLRRIGIVAYEEDGYVHLSDEGRKRIWSLRNVLLVSRDRPWATTQLDRMTPATPYLPDLTRIEKSFFYSKVAKAAS